MFYNKLYFSFFLIFIKFFNVKNYCFKTVSSSRSSSRSYSSKSYKGYNKRNPDIYVKKYKVYKKPKFYNSYYYRNYHPYYNTSYRYYNLYYYSYYYNYYPPYYYNSMPLPVYNNYTYIDNNNPYKYSKRAFYFYRYKSYELMILRILIILFFLIITIWIVYSLRKKSKEEIYIKETYKDNIYENIDFNNPNSILII